MKARVFWLALLVACPLSGGVLTWQAAHVVAQTPAATATDPETATDAEAEAAAETKTRAETATIPPPLTRYLGRTIAQTMSYHGAPWLTRDNRDQEEHTTEVLQQLGLQPGQVVCDLGCGNGYYTLQMAPQVAPQGKVLAVDIQPEMLHLLQLRSQELGLDNVEPILGTVVDPQLPADSVDLILLVDVYHEFSHPPQMLQALRRSLAPGGLIALLEYRQEDPSVPIKPLHKMSKRQILKEFQANGLRLAKQYDGLPWQHLMFFERDTP